MSNPNLDAVTFLLCSHVVARLAAALFSLCFGQRCSAQMGGNEFLQMYAFAERGCAPAALIRNTLQASVSSQTTLYYISTSQIIPTSPVSRVPSNGVSTRISISAPERLLETPTQTLRQGKRATLRPDAFVRAKGCMHKSH
jgi:hypothetical protein